MKYISLSDITDELVVIKINQSCDYYQFAGVYARKRRDNKLGWVYERIAKDIDTKDYL